MEQVKDEIKVPTITFDGYRFACFPNSKDVKKAMELVEKLNLDGAILGSRIDPNEDLGYTLHFISDGIKVNVKRTVSLLVEQGKKNDLYWKHNGIQSQKSARVHSANLKLLKHGN